MYITNLALCALITGVRCFRKISFLELTLAIEMLIVVRWEVNIHINAGVFVRILLCGAAVMQTLTFMQACLISMQLAKQKHLGARSIKSNMQACATKNSDRDSW